MGCGVWAVKKSALWTTGADPVFVPSRAVSVALASQGLSRSAAHLLCSGRPEWGALSGRSTVTVKQPAQPWVTSAMENCKYLLRFGRMHLFWPPAPPNCSREGRSISLKRIANYLGERAGGEGVYPDGFQTSRRTSNESGENGVASGDTAPWYADWRRFSARQRERKTLFLSRGCRPAPHVPSPSHPHTPSPTHPRRAIAAGGSGPLC